MKKLISILLLFVLIFSLSACNKSNNTSSELYTGSQSYISSIETSSQNSTTSNEDSNGEQSSNHEESKPQSSSESPSKDENSNPSTPTPTHTHTHSFSNATCTEPKKCICGATDGVALGHKWNEANCKAPKTCKVCKVIDGGAQSHTFVQGVCSTCGAKDANYIPLKNSVFYKTYLRKNSEGYEIGYMDCLSFGKKQEGKFYAEYVEGIDLETAYKLKWFEGDSIFNSMSIDDIVKKITEANVGDKWYREYFYVGDKMYLPWAGGGPYIGESIEMNDFITVFNDYNGIGRLEYIYNGNDNLEITSFVFDGDDINDGVFSVGDKYIRLTSKTKQNIFAY